MSSHQKPNLILIYTGHGKGKTTAALGLILRALREKMSVLMIQFIKSQKDSGEANLRSILPELRVRAFGNGLVLKKPTVSQTFIFKKQSKQALAYIIKTIKSKKVNILVLDEIWVALSLKLIKNNDILDIIKTFRLSGPNHYLILTGRNCPKSFYQYADLVTEMKEIKHPFKKGIGAVKGIDY
ncbi:MAG TPA: cob(I)yrinic acid a,c-diamide adenosyltransferase [bacterium]|nr:cob(I)yrinic acid a,c-diamide adenosyltransferase [bacterium]